MARREVAGTRFGYCVYSNVTVTLRCRQLYRDFELVKNQTLFRRVSTVYKLQVKSLIISFASKEKSKGKTLLLHSKTVRRCVIIIHV